jgi:hypothetical protein
MQIIIRHHLIIKDLNLQIRNMVRDLCIIWDFTKDPEELKRRQRLIQTNCTVDYFLRLLMVEKLKVGKQKKIIIECSEQPITKITNYDDDSLGVIIVRRQIDLDKYQKLADNAKRKWALDMVVSAFEELHKHFDFSMDTIHDVAKQVEANKYINHYVYGSPVVNKSKDLKAQLFVEYEFDKFDLYAEVYDKDSTLLKKTLVKSVAPGWVTYTPILGSIKWIDNKKLSVLDAKKKELKKISA